MRTARSPWPRLMLVLVTWLAGVGVATAVGLGALRLIGDQVTSRGSRPMSEQAVDSAAANSSQTVGQPEARGALPPAGGLTATPTAKPSGEGPSASPNGSESETPSGTTGSETNGDDMDTFRTEGGLILASCKGGKVEVRAAVPDNNYGSHVTGSGTPRAEVEFAGEEHQVRVAVTCVNGAPRAEVEHDYPVRRDR